MGIGYIMVVPESEATKTMDILKGHQLRSSVIGKIIDDKKNKVTYLGLDKFTL